MQEKDDKSPFYKIRLAPTPSNLNIISTQITIVEVIILENISKITITMDL